MTAEHPGIDEISMVIAVWPLTPYDLESFTSLSTNCVDCWVFVQIPSAVREPSSWQDFAVWPWCSTPWPWKLISSSPDWSGAYLRMTFGEDCFWILICRARTDKFNKHAHIRNRQTQPELMPVNRQLSGSNGRLGSGICTCRAISC